MRTVVDLLERNCGAVGGVIQSHEGNYRQTRPGDRRVFFLVRSFINIEQYAKPVVYRLLLFIQSIIQRVLRAPVPSRASAPARPLDWFAWLTIRMSVNPMSNRAVRFVRWRRTANGSVSQYRATTLTIAHTHTPVHVNVVRIGRRERGWYMPKCGHGNRNHIRMRVGESDYGSQHKPRQTAVASG